MMGVRDILCLFLGSLTLSTALATAAKRQATNYVYDGGFELVSNKVAQAFLINVKGGGWALRDRAIFYGHSSNNPKLAEEGRKLVIFYNDKPWETRGSVSQNLANLPLEPLTLSYYVNNIFNHHPDCTFTASFGDQIVETFDVPMTSDQTGWTQRTPTFTPAQADGKLTFQFLCKGTVQHESWEFHFDNVALTAAG